ncbi:unnamed protein product [Chironomus riparius]|uniref:DNL-type domain-containing protein n=1 Tax=Chironomus riparius TaxID=315576 RepID=A0A9N9RQU5_9DIPT|nr:unnamed protein product [Chironomus riparius]
MNSLFRMCARNALRLVYQSGQVAKRQQINLLAFQNHDMRSSKTFCDNKLGKVDEIKKLYLQFTCKKCQERNSYMISKLAYEKGVVIVECQKCKNNHLIADNLKWFRDQKTNVEDLLRERGEKLLNKTNSIEFIEDEDRPK